MDGFYFHDSGEPFATGVLRRKAFILGKAKMQMRECGVVQLTDGAVRTYSIRYDHNPNSNGHLRTVGEPLRQSFEEAVDGLRRFEEKWITEEKEETQK